MASRSVGGIEELFCDLAKRYFGSVASLHGMDLHEETGAVTVRYENKAVGLFIYLDLRSDYQFGVVIDRIRDGRESLRMPYTLGEILRSQYAPDAVHANAVPIGSADDLKATLYRFSELTEKWASRILDGDEEAFAVLERLRLRETEVAPARAVIRNCIVTAWHEKDYQKVSSLSKAMRPFLTHRELERLSWCEEYLLRGQ